MGISPEADSEVSPYHPEDVAGYPNSKELFIDTSKGVIGSKEAMVAESPIIIGDGIHGPFQLPPPDLNNTCSFVSYNTSSNLLRSPSSSPHYRQKFSSFTFDEMIFVEFIGYKETFSRRILYYTIGIVSLGSSLLTCHWFPKLQVRLKCAVVPLAEATHILCESSFGTLSIEKVTKLPDENDLVFQLFDADDHNISYFEYNYNRFVLNPRSGLFVAVQDLQRIPKEVQDNAFSGLDSKLVARQRQLFGINDVRIQTKSTLQILWTEILHPFNVFQVFSIIVWCCEDYYIYSVIILAIALLSISTTLIDMQRNFARLREMAHFECRVNVVREGVVSEISSVSLVPGDTIVLNDNSLEILPCDLILLNGEILVDETMLTGESIPITKLSILELHEPPTDNSLDISPSNGSEEDVEMEDLEDQDFAPNESIDIAIFGKPEEVPNRSLLYAGTKIVRVRLKHGREALGIVLNTGMYTSRGNLIQSILFPRPNNFKFHHDSLRFVAFMGILAGISFFFSLIALARAGESLKTMVMKALDLITVIVPPALPATMSIGAAFALSRLRKKSIFCISPPKIAVSSNIDRMCFDKTGTLTEEGLRLKGVISVDNTEALVETPRDLKPLFVKLMATCHSVQSVEGRLLGDPLDIEMLAFTGLSLVDRTESLGGVIVSSIMRPQESSTDLELGILKTFEFHSSLRRMTVLVRELQSTDTQVFTKGSPESIKEICTPASIPRNYDTIVSFYAHRGYRLLACAGKTIKHMPWLKLKHYSRERAENSLSLFGFLVFENPLKPKVEGTLRTLQLANITILMCTGDNPLTAICVARACGMVSRSRSALLASLATYDETGKVCVEFENLDDIEAKVMTLDEIYGKATLDDLEFAISGAVFEHLTHPEHIHANQNGLKRLLRHTRVFARMSPQQKQLLVEILQSYGEVIGFCGDGANDCGALKAADVGISLSQAEASIAAPFTSRIMDIECVPTLIKEGRASLATSFSCFKFMTLYSMIQYTSLTCLFLYQSYPTDSQFIYSDLIMIIPLGILMSRFGPSKNLSAEKPISRLMSPQVLASILSAIFLQAAAQCVNVLLPSFWVNSNSIGTSGSLQNTAIFLTSSFLYPMTACIFSVQHPFRQSFYLPFYAFIAAAIVLSLGMTFGVVPSFILRLFCLIRLATVQSIQVVFVVFVTILAAILIEFAVIPRILAISRRRKFNRSSLPMV